MEAVCSETLLSVHKSTRRSNPEDQRGHLHRRDNLKSHKIKHQLGKVLFEITFSILDEKGHELQHTIT
jgi:hypothetical protein